MQQSFPEKLERQASVSRTLLDTPQAEDAIGMVQVLLLLIPDVCVCHRAGVGAGTAAVALPGILLEL